MLEMQLNGSTWDGRAVMLDYKTEDDWPEDIILSLVLRRIQVCHTSEHTEGLL